MIDRSLVRALITSVALAAGVLLAGCNSDEISLANNAKANQPVSQKLIAEMTAKDMDLQSPMLVRLFKQEAELEVWKQDRSGRFALLKTYPICRWSGDLGPKVREGDRQAPEGFYSISPAQMNPQSAYYLSFNTGYPNPPGQIADYWGGNTEITSPEGGRITTNPPPRGSYQAPPLK